MVSLLLAGSLILSASFTTVPSCSSLDSVQWLLGDWRADRGDRVTYETWKQVSPKTFEGMGEVRAKAGNEQVSQEFLHLVEMAGEVFYLAKVAEHERPVPFKLTRCSQREAVFENLDHDFPQRIAYAREGRDRLIVDVTDADGQGFQVRFSRTEDS